MKKYLLALLALAATTAAFAASGPRIEEWKRDGLVFTVRDSQGQFVKWGELKLESWNDGDNRSEWVVRHQDGTFVTGYKGTLEKFKVKKGEKEQTRLVIRNADGEFVTWEPMDALLTTGWERQRDGNWRYVIRYEGKYVNWAQGKIETWSRYGRVLVVRDTADDTNNGKILSWIVPERIQGADRYRDPATGRFIKPAGVR